MPIELKEIVPWGRTLREYELMFGLTKADLSLKILGCGDGPASFNAEWTRRGGTVVSIDPIYEFSGPEIQQRFEAVSHDIIAGINETPERWSWGFHGNSEALLAQRRLALDKFLADYETGKSNSRYQQAALPILDFPAHAFDLAISSHLLFLYTNLLSFDFHLQGLQELCRIAAEVRIFPLLDLVGHPSRYLKPICSALEKMGIETKVETVAYEFQKGGNQMLRLRYR